MLETSKEVLDDILSMITMVHSCTSFDINRNEILCRQSRRCLLVELGNRVQHINSLLIATSADEELRGFVEVEDEVSQEEDHESHATEHDDFITPSHVVLDAAAGAAGGVVVAGRKCRIRPVLRGCAVSYAGCGHDTNGLPDGKQRDKVTAALGEELERDGGVDGNVTTETEGGEEVDSADGAIVVHGSREEKTEDGGDQASEVECPATTDDVDGQTPEKCSDGETGVGARPDVTFVVGWDVHLLVNGSGDQTDTLRPGEIEEVSETAEEPDADLVSSHAEFVNLGVDHGGLLLEVGHGLGSGTLHDGGDGEVGLVSQFELIVDGDIARVACGLLVGVEVTVLGATGHGWALELFIDGIAAMAHGEFHPYNSISIQSHWRCKSRLRASR
jgi:hypothetical protein